MQDSDNTTPEDPTTLESVISAAAEADTKGVPVDWKAICVQTYNTLTAKINTLSTEASKISE